MQTRSLHLVSKAMLNANSGDLILHHQNGVTMCQYPKHWHHMLSQYYICDQNMYPTYETAYVTTNIRNAGMENNCLMSLWKFYGLSKYVNLTRWHFDIEHFVLHQPMTMGALIWKEAQKYPLVDIWANPFILFVKLGLHVNASQENSQRKTILMVE